jgi:DNA mismatch repair ATPase MutL
LSSIAGLGLVDIMTRARESRRSLSKVIKVGRAVNGIECGGYRLMAQGSKILYEGQSSRSIAGPHGTVITVRDLFHNVSYRTTGGARS